MNFFDILEKTRERPENDRKIITAVVTAVIMIVIVFIWISTIDLSDSSSQSSVSESEVQTTDSNVASPLESVGSIFSKVEDGLSKMKADFDNKMQEFQGNGL